MHNRLHMFLNDNNVIHPLQFDLKYSTSFALIHLTETIKEALDQGKYGIFVDLQKAFETVDHNILMGKLKYHGIREVTYSWFESYLKRNKAICLNQRI